INGRGPPARSGDARLQPNRESPADSLQMQAAVTAQTNYWLSAQGRHCEARAGSSRTAMTSAEPNPSDAVRGPERVGLVLVHGIGEQRRFQHLDGQLRDLIRALHGLQLL